jgi:hypothetical protein
MTPGTDGDGLAAALIQISGHAERIGGLDARETAHHEDTTARLREAAADAASVRTRIDAISATIARHAAIVDALDGLDGQVAALARQLTHLTDSGDELEDPDSYRPVPPPRWWKLTGAEHDAALDRLRAWVEQIYRPGYGKIAAMLPPCWEHHPLCLYMLDWLSELWSVLYLRPERTGGVLASQAEWQTRLLPAAAEQMAYDATGCPHTPGATRRQAPASTYPRPPLR